jgi:hypothetical protein
MNRSTWQKFVALGIVLVLGAATGALAQESTGNVFALVKDTGGNPLPGVTCELSGMGATQVQVSNAAGEVRWLRLDPGNWSLRCSLEGFSTVEYPAISVRVARNVSIEVALAEAIGEVITVTSESPLLDERRISTGTTITQVELETIPTARDPWAVVAQTPGVLVDRINVGGNESGQQSTFRAPGTDSFENTFLVDGVETTDMAATGASPSYWDFDQFSEMQFETGGGDVTKVAAGVSLNLVTKRGTNEFRGSARFYRTDDSMFGWETQETPVFTQPDSILADTQPSFVGNTINQVTEYGFEAGGPVVRDRLWFWGSFGANDIRNRTGGNTLANVQADDTILENTAFKFNWQIVSANSFVGSWNNGDKKKFGRNAGSTRPQETTWDQRGPTAIYKFEDTHVFSSSFFLGGTYGKVDGGFSLTSKACIAAGGCANAPETLWDNNGVWRRSYQSGPSSRPSEEYKLDGSYFFNTGGSSHELKFGGRLRNFEQLSTFAWPGRNLFTIDMSRFGFPQGIEQVVGVAGYSGAPNSTEYTSLWVQDTISLGRWTINAGLRYDDQTGTNDAVVSPGNATFPGTLPDLDYAGEKEPFSWSNVLPRLGVTYALGEERKTLIRGSFAQFAQQLAGSNILYTNAAGSRYSYYYWNDANGDLYFDEAERDSLDFQYCAGCPNDFVTAATPNRTEGFDPELTTEGVIGVQHSFLPELVVGAEYTYRDRSDINWFRNLLETPDGTIRAELATDYERAGSVGKPLPDGTVVSAPRYALRDGFSNSGGDLQTTSSRSIQTNAFGVNFIKRLSNQWMARGFLQWSRGEWDVPSDYNAGSDPNPNEFGSDISGTLYGEDVGTRSGAKGDVFLESSWSWNLNGMYQFAPDRPYGFNIAANLYGREGYPLPYYFSSNPSDGLGTRNISVMNGDIDRFRADDIFTTDLRLEKEFAASGNVGFTFSIDIFNLFNEAYVMQRERNQNTSRYDFLDESLAPRIWRLGVRLNWR